MLSSCPPQSSRSSIFWTFRAQAPRHFGHGRACRHFAWFGESEEPGKSLRWGSAQPYRSQHSGGAAHIVAAMTIKARAPRAGMASMEDEYLHAASMQAIKRPEVNCCPIACAAASRSLRSASISGLLKFSDIAAIIVALGTIWCSSSSRFAANTLLRKLTPVTLPPGRLRLATRPSLTGSPPVTKTTGTVDVTALAANAERVLQTIRATCWRTKSATRVGNRWG